MRASIEAQGFTATAEIYPDGTLTLSLTNASGHALAVGTWAQAVPAESPSIRPAEAWPARGAA
jgi:hypothetical protein